MTFYSELSIWLIKLISIIFSITVDSKSDHRGREFLIYRNFTVFIISLRNITYICTHVRSKKNDSLSSSFVSFFCCFNISRFIEKNVFGYLN